MANSHNILKSRRSTPGTRRPSEPKMECSPSKDNRFEASRACLWRHIVETTLHRRPGLQGNDECRIPCCCVLTCEIFVRGLMRCYQCRHDIDGEEIMRKVKAGIEREDLVECLIDNSFIARIKMQNFESVNALLFL